MDYADLTQNQQVIKYINEFESISQLEAARDLGIFRLAARIYDLKSQGYQFDSYTESSVNRFGINTSFKRYSLECDADHTTESVIMV